MHGPAAPFFGQYCQQTYSLDMLECLRAIEDYRLTAQNDAETLQKAQDIYDRFMDESAPQLINMQEGGGGTPDQKRNRVQNAMQPLNFAVHFHDLFDGLYKACESEIVFTFIDWTGTPDYKERWD